MMELSNGKCIPVSAHYTTEDAQHSIDRRTKQYEPTVRHYMSFVRIEPPTAELTAAVRKHLNPNPN